MKKEELYECMGDIDEVYVKNAHLTKKHYRLNLWSWGAAACFALAAVLVSQVMTSDVHNIETSLNARPELSLERRYVYNIEQGEFRSYIGGRVISEERIGRKIGDVIVAAGWRNSVGQRLNLEKLRGEVYQIDGVSSNIAVALRFIDKGEALTTTHFYVILNPDADLTLVKDYVIRPSPPVSHEESAVPE